METPSAICALAALRERCAQAAYEYLDDPFLSGHGYATGCADAIRSEPLAEYHTYIVDYVAEVEGRRFKTNTRLEAFSKDDAARRAAKNNPMFVEAIRVYAVG